MRCRSFMSVFGVRIGYCLGGPFFAFGVIECVAVVFFLALEVLLCLSRIEFRSVVSLAESIHLTVTAAVRAVKRRRSFFLFLD